VMQCWFQEICVPQAQIVLSMGIVCQDDAVVILVGLVLHVLSWIWNHQLIPKVMWDQMVGVLGG
jgi:hypothetical protein